METREGLFLFRTGAIILEVCRNNPVERDKILMQERETIVARAGVGLEALCEHRAHLCNRREVDIHAYVKVGQFSYGKMRSFSSECFYFFSEIISEVTS